jgi:hypothetical protein
MPSADIFEMEIARAEIIGTSGIEQSWERRRAGRA